MKSGICHEQKTDIFFSRSLHQPVEAGLKSEESHEDVRTAAVRRLQLQLGRELQHLVLAPVVMQILPQAPGVLLGDFDLEGLLEGGEGDQGRGVGNLEDHFTLRLQGLKPGGDKLASIKLY